MEECLVAKLQAEDCNFTKSNTPPWVFFTFNFHKWYKSRKASKGFRFLYLFIVKLSCNTVNSPIVDS